MLQITPTAAARPWRKVAVMLAVPVIVIATTGIIIVATKNPPPAPPLTRSPAVVVMAEPPVVPPFEFPRPAAPLDVYAAVRAAMIAAGVDEDKVAGPAADLSAAIERSIRAQTNGLRWFGEIAIGSLVPLWIIALVALFGHQRERVDLSHLERVLERVRYVAVMAEYAYPPQPPTPFAWRPPQ
jgi:hypothetical protein